MNDPCMEIVCDVDCENKHDDQVVQKHKTSREHKQRLEGLVPVGAVVGVGVHRIGLLVRHVVEVAQIGSPGCSGAPVASAPVCVKFIVSRSLTKLTLGEREKRGEHFSVRVFACPPNSNHLPAPPS